MMGMGVGIGCWQGRHHVRVVEPSRISVVMHRQRWPRRRGQAAQQDQHHGGREARHQGGEEEGGEPPHGDWGPLLSTVALLLVLLRGFTALFCKSKSATVTLANRTDTVLSEPEVAHESDRRPDGVLIPPQVR